MSTPIMGGTPPILHRLLRRHRSSCGYRMAYGAARPGSDEQGVPVAVRLDLHPFRKVSRGSTLSHNRLSLQLKNTTRRRVSVATSASRYL
jgi:hypothetical protein